MRNQGYLAGYPICFFMLHLFSLFTIHFAGFEKPYAGLFFCAIFTPL
jgi:hypothetical protein